jgi:uncharacterized protein GlcG (DUF336 family)
MKALLITALAASVVYPCFAQTPLVNEAPHHAPSIAARIEAMPKDLPRARGPGLTYALQLAQAALGACKAEGENFSILVTDSAGIPVVLFSGDGAGERSELIARSKAYTVVKYRMSSTAVKQKARIDPELAKEISLNPNIGEARFGALPLMSGGELIGVLSITGIAGGGDEACAKAAIAKAPLR